MAAGARAEERGRGGARRQDQHGVHGGLQQQGRAWGDPSSGWLFHAPRRGTSSERFGIFRASDRSAAGRPLGAPLGGNLGHLGRPPGLGLGLGPPPAARGLSKGRRMHATRWAVLAALAAMAALFVCLLLIDMTSVEKPVNATSRSFAVEQEGVAEPGQDPGRHPGGRVPSRGPAQGQEELQAAQDHAPNHRYPFHYAHPHLRPYLRLREHGRSLKAHQEEPSTADEDSAAHAPDDSEGYGDRADWEDDDTGGSEDEENEAEVADIEEDAERSDVDEGEIYDHYDEEDGDLAPAVPFSTVRALRSLNGGEARSRVSAPDANVPTATGPGEDLQGGDRDLDEEAADEDGRDADDSAPVTSTASRGGAEQAADPQRPSSNEDSQDQSASIEDTTPSGAGQDTIQILERRDSTEHDPSETMLVPERLTSAEALRGLPPEEAVALPYHGAVDRRWVTPGTAAEEMDRDRWVDLVRMQQLQQLQQQRNLQAQRRNFFAELGTIQGEQYMLPHYSPASLQDNNLGPVLFPAPTKQHAEAVLFPSHSSPKKHLMKFVVPPQASSAVGGSSKPWTFFGHTGQTNNNNNQYLVVNSKGVVIPHSVNFPDIVKTANFPQLQSYHNQQSNKNLQDILDYLKSRGQGLAKRPYSLSGVALKKVAKAPTMYVTPHQLESGQAMDLDMVQFPRQEPYVKEMPPHDQSSAESAERPDSFYNGHAYIADPFHPYKPSDPTEINQMVTSGDSDTSASASSERVRHPGPQGHLGFVDEVGEPFSYAQQRPMASGQVLGAGRFSRYRNPLLQPGSGPPHYTEATFKPLGGIQGATETPTQVASDSQASAAVRGGPGKGVPPLSLMLEIYPMGEASKHKEGAATVMWNNFPVAALRPVVRRPVQSVVPGLGAGFGAGLGAGLGSLAPQAESTVRRPVTFPLDNVVASASVPSAAKFPVLMHGQLSTPGQTQPAYGVTLTGVQGLQNLAGMPMLDSKHRMVLHLNFYPKKTVSMPLRFRGLTSGGDHVGQGATLIPGGTFSQRRQSLHEDPEPGQLAVDVAPLIHSLPVDVQSHLAAILQTYQRPSRGLSSSLKDVSVEGSDDTNLGSDEDYMDVDEAVDEPNPNRLPPKAQVDAQPSFNSSSSEEDANEAPPLAPWLGERTKLWPESPPKRTVPEFSFPPVKNRRGSYFDVQSDEDEDEEEDDDFNDINHEADYPRLSEKRIEQQVGSTLTPRDRLALWRYWKEMQARRRHEDLDRRQEKRKRRRKKVAGRTQRHDSKFDEGENLKDITRDVSTVPKNHRLE